MELKLEVFPGGFGLPSMDFDCLRAILFCKMARINIEVVDQINLRLHKVPCLKESSSGIILAQNFFEIIDYFRENPSITTGSSQSLSDMFINGTDQFSIAIRQKLKPAFLQIWWREEECYNELLRSWYAGKLPFPINFFWPRRLRNEALDEFASLVPFQVDHNNFQKVGKEVLDNAESYIKDLSRYLISIKPSIYLLGNKPTIADVDLLTYLLMFHRAPAKNIQLKLAIKESKPILNYVEIAADRFLENSPEINSGDLFVTNNTTMESKTRDFIFSGAFAVSVMIIFAATHGLFTDKS